VRKPCVIEGKPYVELHSYGEKAPLSIASGVALKHFAGRPIKILEIGVLRGHHAEAMWVALRPELLVLVDPWDFYGEETHDSNLADTWHRMQGKEHVITIKARSDQAFHILRPDLMFDYIYLDGDHLPDGFNLDMSLWPERVAPGGILAGHDYNFPNISEEVHRQFGDRVHHTNLPMEMGGIDWWVFI